MRTPRVHADACICRECQARRRARHQAKTAAQLALRLSVARGAELPAVAITRKDVRIAAGALATVAEEQRTDRMIEELKMAEARSAADPRAARLLELCAGGLSLGAALEQVEKEEQGT